MDSPKEYRFQMTIDNLPCEVLIIRLNGINEILTVNVMDDCVISTEDLSNEQKEAILINADNLIKNEN